MLRETIIIFKKYNYILYDYFISVPRYLMALLITDYEGKSAVNKVV